MNTTPQVIDGKSAPLVSDEVKGAISLMLVLHLRPEFSTAYKRADSILREECSPADCRLAGEWIRRANAGDAEAQRVVDAIPPSFEPDPDDGPDLTPEEEHAYLRSSLENVLRGNPMCVGTKAILEEALEDQPAYMSEETRQSLNEAAERFGLGGGRIKAAERHLDRHKGRLPKAKTGWAPAVRANSIPAMAWECLVELSPNGEPVTPDTWLEQTIQCHFSGSDSIAERRAAFASAKNRLRGQGAFKEAKDGTIRRRV